MKLIKILTLFSIALVLTLASCTKENSIVDKTDPPVVTPNENTTNPLVGRMVNTEESIDLGCFSISTPFSVTLNDEEFEINSWEDFENALNSIDNPEEAYFDFVYPLNIVYTEDESEATIADAEELAVAFSSCIPETGWGESSFPAFLISEQQSCYDFSYPIQLQNENGDTFSAADENEFTNYIAENMFVTIVFPINIIELETGNILAVADENELFEYIFSCDNDYGIDTTIFVGCGITTIACYDIGFPVNYSNMDGDLLVANDIDELNTAMMNGSFYNFEFPIILIDMDGNETTVNNDEEMNTAIEACGDIFNPNDDFFLLLQLDESPCYDMIFPFSVISSGDEVLVESMDDIFELLEDSFDIELIYPLNIMDTENNIIVELNSSEDLFNALINCQ